MAGELWRSTAQIGLEVTPATPVAATRKVYWTTPNLSIEKASTVHRSASGRRDNVFAVTQGSTTAGGSLAMPMSADEVLEVFNMGISGAPVITTPATGVTARLHTFKPADLASATIEYNDGKRTWQGAGFRANTLTITGSAAGDNDVSADLFGADMIAGSLTGALSDRDPSFIQGWQTRMYMEAVAGTPGTTVIAGTLVSWTVTLSNNLDRRYTADNTQGANRVISGELDVTAELVFDSDSAQALTEFTNWSTSVKRMVRLEFQDETAFIETALRRFVTLDIGGAWTAVDISGSDGGIRTYSMSLQSIYNATQAAMLVARVQCPRTAAFV